MTPTYFNRISILLVAWLAFAGCNRQPTAAEDLQAIMDKYEAVGMSVAVVKDNKLIYNESFGFKDIARKAPLQNDDIFRIASISKSFTATSLMQLVEAGKLSLDADVSDLVGFRIRNPKFPETIITLRMILSHTSSISDKNGYFTLDIINPDKNPEWSGSYNDYAPGMGYQYCNLNFNLAGTILERISGDRFDQYVKHHILDPLGLYGGYDVDSLDNEKFVTLYTYNSDSLRFEVSPEAYASRSDSMASYTMGYSTPIFSPTGGMKISAVDLARYMMVHMNYGTSENIAIISKESAQTMQTPLSDDEHYGLALWTMDNLIPGKTMVGHTGSAYGLYSAMFFHPEEKFGLVVITNGCNATFTDDFNDFLKESLNSLYTHYITTGPAK